MTEGTRKAYPPDLTNQQPLYDLMTIVNLIS